MTQAHDPATQGEFPFSTMLRASDRERLLVQVVGPVWESVLAQPLLKRDEAEDLDDDPRHFPALVGTIGISGAWEGTVALSGPFSFAAECGATMYGRPAAEPAASRRLAVGREQRPHLRRQLVLGEGLGQERGAGLE